MTQLFSSLPLNVTTMLIKCSLAWIHVKLRYPKFDRSAMLNMNVLHVSIVRGYRLYASRLTIFGTGGDQLTQ